MSEGHLLERLGIYRGRSGASESLKIPPCTGKEIGPTAMYILRAGPERTQYRKFN